MTLKKQEQSFFSWCTANIYGWDWIRSDQNEKQFTFIKQLCSFEIKLTTFYHFSRLFPGLEKFAGLILDFFKNSRLWMNPLYSSALMWVAIICPQPPTPPPTPLAFQDLYIVGLKGKNGWLRPGGCLIPLCLSIIQSLARFTHRWTAVISFQNLLKVTYKQVNISKIKTVLFLH